MTDYPYHLTISSSVSTEYSLVGRGGTDSICILGFADTAYPQQVYKVTDMNQAFADFTGSTTLNSSLLQGLMAAYYAGGRDFYLYAVGDMDEWVAPASRDGSWHTLLEARYTTALEEIAEWDDIDILVPYDAEPTPTYNYVEQFSDACSGASGLLRLAIIPYYGDEDTVFDGESLHVVLVDGTGTFDMWKSTDIFVSHSYDGNMAPVFAGMLSRMDTNVPPDNRKIKVPVAFSSSYEGEEETLETNRIVGFRKTTNYKRNSDGELVTTLCRTRSEDGSDYQSLYVVHTVMRLLRDIDDLDLIGTPAVIAKDTLKEFFNAWVVKGYAINIEASFVLKPYEMDVIATLYLFYPIGEITVSFTVGPLA